MSDDGELSDDELNDLISDLESRSEESGSASAESGGGDLPEGEDLEAFLQQVEGDSGDSQSTSGEATVAYADGAEEEPSLPELEELNKDQPPAETESSKPVSDADDGGGSEESAGEDVGAASEGGAEEAASGTSTDASEGDAQSAESSPYLRYAWVAVKWIGFVLPVISLWWLLGAYLGQWVSAGWLILAMTTLVVFGLPKIAYDYSNRRGRYRWWLAGMSLVLSVGLVAPLSGTAGRALAGYGHWPGAAVSEIAGADVGIGSVTGGIGTFLGQRLNPGIAESATGLELGTTAAGAAEASDSSDSGGVEGTDSPTDSSTSGAN